MNEPEVSTLAAKEEKVIQAQAHMIKPAPNTFKDPRDGQVYKTIQLKDGKIWLAQNLNLMWGKTAGFMIISLKTESSMAGCTPGKQLNEPVRMGGIFQVTMNGGK